MIDAEFQFYTLQPRLKVQSRVITVWEDRPLPLFEKSYHREFCSHLDARCLSR